MTINFGELLAEAGTSFDPVPENDYLVTVDKVTPKTSSTQKPMWNLELSIVGGEHAGRKLWHSITLSTGNQNALRMFFIQMIGYGLQQEFFQANPTAEQIALNLTGKQAIVTVKHRLYKGVKKEDVHSVRKAEPGTTPEQVGVASTIGQAAQTLPTALPSQPAPAAQPVAAQPAPVAQPAAQPVQAAPAAPVAAAAPVAPVAAAAPAAQPAAQPAAPVEAVAQPVAAAPVEAAPAAQPVQAAPVEAPAAAAPAPAPEAAPVVQEAAPAAAPVPAEAPAAPPAGAAAPPPLPEGF